MKLLFLILLCWSVGFVLPLLTAALQLIIAVVAVLLLVACVFYYIDTRVNAVRL
jgi:hypothetical protein